MNGTDAVPNADRDRSERPDLERDLTKLLAADKAEVAEGFGRFMDTWLDGQELERLRAEVAELRAALTELAPSDEVLVEGSYFQRADLPRILRNYMRTSADHAREAKEEFVKRQSAEAALARVRALAIKFEQWPSGPSFAVTARAIRAALDGER